MNKKPEISEFDRMHMPDATYEEQLLAMKNVERFLDGIDRIYERLKSERRFPLERDKSGARDMNKEI